MPAKFSELHGLGANGAYYNERPMRCPEIECKCGFVAVGDNWQEVGREFDQHLSDARQTMSDEADAAREAVWQ